MRKRIVNNIGLAIVSAVLLIVAWPTSSLNFLLLVAFVPVLIVCFRQEKALHAIGYFYLTMLIFIVESQSTVMAQGEYVGPLIAGLFILPIFWAIPIGLAVWLKSRKGIGVALITFPFLYLSHEVLEYYWDFAVTWFHLGLGLSNNSFFHGIYPILGQEGASLLVLIFNVSIVYVLLNWRNKSWRHAMIPISVLALFLLASLLPSSEYDISPRVEIAVFQPSTEEVSKLENDLAGQIELLEKELDAKDFSKVDLLVCPESYFFDMEKQPLVVNNLHEHPAIKRLQTISSELNTAILSGAILVQLFQANKPPTNTAKQMRPGVFFDVYNGSIFITPDKNVQWRTKQTLVPFSENIPFHGLFNKLESVGLWPNRFDKAYGKVPFSGPYMYNNLRIAPGVCFESLFPHVMSKYIDKKANIQIILSTKWTESKSVMNQHKDHMTVNVKALGTPLLFATTDQESFFINDHGKKASTDDSLSFMEIELYNSKTVYSQIAKKPWLWWIITVFVTFGTLTYASINARPK